MLIPVNDNYNDATHKIKLQLLKEDIRVKIDDTDERLSKKIREAQIKKIPYQVVIGEKEIKSKSVTYRQYGKSNETNVSLNDFIKLLKNQIKLMK